MLICVPKPEMTSSNILFGPQLKDMQFDITDCNREAEIREFWLFLLKKDEQI